MSDDADVKPAAPLYWCGHCTSLNVHPCQSCVEEYGKQTAYYRESDYLALVAERDKWKHRASAVGAVELLARAEAAEARVAELEECLRAARGYVVARTGTAQRFALVDQIGAALTKESTDE